VWGLTARQLHEAFWNARGVQCIRRGERQTIHPATELALLIEPGHLVLFDLRNLIDRLIWRNAAVSRVRITDHEADLYSERIVVDESGLVEKIERNYSPRSGGVVQVILTRSRRISKIWMAAKTHREGWKKIRRTVGPSGFDHCRCLGGSFREGDASQEDALIGRLVSLWRNPAQAIEGLEQFAEGVFGLAGDEIASDTTLIGPLWLGRSSVTDAGACLVGPMWTADRKRTTIQDDLRATIRDIDQVELSEASRDAHRSATPRVGYAFAKRTFDILVSLVVLLVSSPALAIVALCIVVEDGRPVFYGHTRQTRGGRPFRCWKFRTMHRHVETLTPELAANNVCDGPHVFIRNDPRVTRVGRVIRRFQIDEFPQFWNVFVGQMSIVGPRPSPDAENQFCPAWRELRLSVRPGITGLWQLRRRRTPGEDFQEWIKYDMEYVRRSSFWLDLSLCVNTAWLLLTGRRG
jgi:lipopolysaccharide/colanic/teichoic acid biosynthesis glycosyltransferase